MTYVELLNCKEWRAKCNEILKASHFHCQDCGRLGFHNGGNYMVLNSLKEIDKLLYDVQFCKKSFSEFVQWIPKDVHPDKKIEDITYYENETIEYEDATLKHFFIRKQVGL